MFNPPKDMTVENSWPEEKDVKKLAEECGGLFFYASSALGYIFDDCVFNPPKMLGALLARSPEAQKDRG